ncbi:MAG: DNA-binding response regulator [Muribaculaceae bacterium]|nr:DNA-binding response regulator [Muribaculaceae bacterium]
MDNKLNCIIIDDEPLARELLKTYIFKTPSLSLSGCYESAADAIKSVVEGEVDLIFLDINMPMLNGIDFASLVPASTRIIFVTAYDRYALEGEPLISLMPLHEIEELLPQDIFMRVHRSFIVNIPEVRIIERNRIIFDNIYIPISESKREEFFSRLGK